ncbi:hypothetical protein RHMOL_Rhmol01G0325500 [Rhododendron molle]|uniref:Uncharacterized protein n=2 Tax=Rhododendron molle TaxID=49168 RepID=A0ACC0QAN9_RHOML|nr:hypothetical protein RHMOL_Rhmol01G0325500 [Rhododendron molle]
MGPKRSHRNIPPTPHAQHPLHEGIMDYDVRLRHLKPIQKPLEGLFQLGQSSFQKAGKIGGPTYLRRDYVGDGGKANVGRLGLGAEEAEPLLRHDEGDWNLFAFGNKQITEAHHGVDVAPTGALAQSQFRCIVLDIDTAIGCIPFTFPFAKRVWIARNYKIFCFQLCAMSAAVGVQTKSRTSVYCVGNCWHLGYVNPVGVAQIGYLESNLWEFHTLLVWFSSTAAKGGKLIANSKLRFGANGYDNLRKPLNCMKEEVLERFRTSTKDESASQPTSELEQLS